MAFELHCPRCRSYFEVPSHSPAFAALEHIAEESPWSVLGDGETFEDRLYNALTNEEAIRCPDCGGPIQVSEETLSRFSRELLAHW
ncbi:MAG: hypothetical protein E6K70_13335 [Planctomycetota bacterium]|jgi:hypothetical protein|nr:MAG: hypothetical protein E6K70_13335 [Planctomycetota bacterium]